MFNTPYKINSLVLHLSENKIYMVTHRRLNRDFQGMYIMYTVIEPHRPNHRVNIRHFDLAPVEAS